jgi:hypothetical protein
LKSSPCFEHYATHLQEVYVVIVYMQPLVSSLSAGDFPVHRLEKNFFLNPLNSEVNPICHLLILLGDLKFMGPCIVSISNKMQRYTVYSYLETALHVSGGTSTHHQERIELHLVFVTPLLLSAAIVEELEQTYSCMRS